MDTASQNDTLDKNNSFEFLKLTKLRADKGISKTKLASEAGVTVNTISAAEKRIGNRYETLMKIFNILNGDRYYAGILNQDDLVIRKAKR